MAGDLRRRTLQAKVLAVEAGRQRVAAAPSVAAGSAGLAAPPLVVRVTRLTHRLLRVDGRRGIQGGQ